MKDKLLLVVAIISILAVPTIGLTAEALTAYPQISLLGYKKWINDRITIDPLRNYFSYISTFESWRTGRDNGPWLELLDLSIAGKLSEDRGVDYRFFSTPYGREIFNVRINYKEYGLYFGDLDRLLFADKSLFAVDSINGAGFSGEWGGWGGGLILSAKYPKSNVTGDFNNLIYFRSPEFNGQKIPRLDDDPNLEYWSIDLKRINIEKNDVEVFIDGKKLPGDNYYVVNGLMLFPAIFKDSKTARIAIKHDNGQNDEKTYEIMHEAKKRAFLVPYFRLRDRAEEVRIDGVRVYRGIDYTINYNLGLIVLNRPIPEDAEVKINYKYALSSKSQDVFAGWVGNDLTDWNKLSVSYMRINRTDMTPRIEPELTVINLQDRLNINENAYFLGEISASNGTGESGSAIRLEGVTKSGLLALRGVYGSVDPNYASVRKVRENIKSKSNESTINAEYGLNDNLILRAGHGSYSSQEGSTTVESNAVVSSVGFTWKPLPAWLTEADYKICRGDSAIKTLGVYQRIGLIDQSQAANWISKTSNIILKYSLIRDNSLNNESSKWQSGWQNDFIGGILLYLNWVNEDIKDLTSGINLQKIGPYGRISYTLTPWDGIRCEIYSDYSTVQQRASNASSDQKDVKYGVLVKTPIDNPVLTGFDLGIEIKTSEYTDNFNGLNNYKANEIRFQGAIDF